MEPNKNHPNIKLATRKDKAIIHNIIKCSFIDYEGFKWLLESTKNPKKLDVLIDYLIDEIFNKGFIYINHDQSGVSMWATQKKETLSINLVRRTLMMAVNFSLPTLFRLLKFQHITHKQLPSKGDYYYLISLAVMPDSQGKGVASQLINPILVQCNTQDVSTYLETSYTNNVEIYKKKGFNLTKTKHFSSVSFYFMKT